MRRQEAVIRDRSNSSNTCPFPPE